MSPKSKGDPIVTWERDGCVYRSKATCNAQLDWWICTELVNHTGPHKACGSDPSPIVTWERDGMILQAIDIVRRDASDLIMVEPMEPPDD